MTTTRTSRAARRAPPRTLLAAVATGLALAAATPAARAAIEDSYSPGEPPVSTTWFGPASAKARQTDLDYVAGMRPHHAGALSMSRDYLADPGRSSPLLQALARAIVANQTFEIGVLDEVGRNLDRPPVRLPFGVALQPQATEGLAGTQRFFKEPIPSGATYAFGPVSERDVQFAKAMILHHQAALDMARDYLADRDARNGFLGLMNVDIVTDQTQEIALLRRAIAAYPGDPDAVRVDPSMVHGMEGMKHRGGGHAAATASPPPRGAANEGHAHRGGGSDHAAHGPHGAHQGARDGHEKQHRLHHGDGAGHGHRDGAADHHARSAAKPQPRPAQRSRPTAAQQAEQDTGHGGPHGEHGHHH
ncbi:MAG: DUF305 domain-containing protein [Acetobacteraceae bacterium]|nr:DUF305 domain-containing protein [Acetobacteraceae bacterium]